MMNRNELSPKEAREYTEFLIFMGIGQIALVKAWLKKFRLPFRDEDISHTINEKGHVKNFTVKLHNETLQAEYERTGGYPPGSMKKGRIYVVFEYDE